MATHRFLVNLRPETISNRFRASFRPLGYLVPGNAPTSAQMLTRDLAGQGLAVLVDNGYFDDIARIAALFDDESGRLRQRVQTRERRLGRNVRPGELDTASRDAYRDLAGRARTECLSATADRARTLTAQRGFSPTLLVGAEDITMATWLALNIEPAYLNMPRRTYARMNERVARLATNEIGQLPRALAAGYYAVASAVDYNTAFDAGRVFAEAGLERAAMGFGAYMADDNYTDFQILGRRRLDLPVRMPNRYLRTALVACGFWSGYKAVSGDCPRAFHFLGLGAPIMIGLVALAGWGTSTLTYDATSPIRDAVEGTIYVSAPAPLKVRTRRIAMQLASGVRRSWNCPCPFCRTFVAKHPFNYSAGRAWYRRHPGQEPNAANLRPGGALFKAFPLLSEPAAGELRAAVTAARIAHNHWALAKITLGLNASSSSRDKLSSHVRGLVEAYERTTDAPQFGAAVSRAYTVTSGGA